MRVNQIDCPKCGASLKSKAGIPVGQALACPKCRHKFTVKEPEDADVVDDADIVDDAEGDGRPAVGKKGPPPVARGKPAPRDDDDDLDDDDPRPKKRRPASRGEDDDDEDEEPRPKKRNVRSRDDDDDEDERPRKKKRRRDDDDEKEQSLYWRLRSNIALRIIVWVILLTTLAVVAFLFYEYKIKDAGGDQGSLSGREYTFVEPMDSPV